MINKTMVGIILYKIQNISTIDIWPMVLVTFNSCFLTPVYITLVNYVGRTIQYS